MDTGEAGEELEGEEGVESLEDGNIKDCSRMSSERGIGGGGEEDGGADLKGKCVS